MSGPDYASLSTEDQIRRASDLARVVHMGQKDKQGEDYILHPMQVEGFYRMHRALQFVEEMYAFEDGDGPLEPYWGRAACWLHDAIEDTPLRMRTLIDLGFPSRVINLVSLLTHREDEPRRSYLARIRRDPTALAVKAADQDHNTDPLRLDAVERIHGLDERLRLEDKYAKGYAILGIKPLEGRPTLRRKALR